MICKKIEKHLETNYIIAEEQKGCRKRSQGCKEQLTIDSVIMKQAEKQQRNIHTCYIDYKKAFDSVPHSWLLKILDIYKIHPMIKSFLRHVMTTWKTRIHLTTSDEEIITENIEINRGIFQGDSLSALWFCMCLNPLSNALNDTNHRFQIKHQKTVKHTINHLLYMDDIKLYAPSQTQMKNMLKITEHITNDIKMEFGINKCKILHIEREKWKEEIETEILNDEELRNMQQNETYKYLGFQQNTRINHTEIKEHIVQEYKKRLTLLMNTKLNSKNLFKAINTYAIPLLTYSFGIIKWTQTDLENINRLTRTEQTKHRNHHPHACKERITIGRKEGGRGMMDVVTLHTNQIQKLRNFFYIKQSLLHRAIVQADREYTPLNLSHTQQIYNTQTQQQKIEEWTQKKLHGKHIYNMKNEYISKTDSYKWLQKGELYPETEGFTLAIQDQVIATRNYKKYIMKDPNTTDDKCRKCHQFPETIDHITAGCKLMVESEYTNRHNTAAKIIHQQLALQHKLITETQPYYTYTPQTILENEE